MHKIKGAIITQLCKHRKLTAKQIGFFTKIYSDYIRRHAEELCKSGIVHVVGTDHYKEGGGKVRIYSLKDDWYKHIIIDRRKS